LIPAQSELIGKMLDAAALRHRVIAQNVANVNTPGYRRLQVTFEGELERALQRGGGTGRVQPQVVEAPGGTARADGNNVDIDREMGQLMKNSMLFNAFTQV